MIDLYFWVLKFIFTFSFTLISPSPMNLKGDIYESVIFEEYKFNFPISFSGFGTIDNILLFVFNFFIVFSKLSLIWFPSINSE